MNNPFNIKATTLSGWILERTSNNMEERPDSGYIRGKFDFTLWPGRNNAGRELYRETKFYFHTKNYPGLIARKIKKAEGKIRGHHKGGKINESSESEYLSVVYEL